MNGQAVGQAVDLCRDQFALLKNAFTESQGYRGEAEFINRQLLPLLLLID